jgi:hypothetical protein
MAVVLPVDDARVHGAFIHLAAIGIRYHPAKHDGKDRRERKERD